MSDSNLELEIEKFYNKQPAEGIQKEPVIVNGINAYPLTFLMNHGEIIRIEFEYESKNSKIQKSSLDACKLKITGSIINVLNNNPLYMHLLRRWSKQKISKITEQFYNANDEFYKKLTINCYGIRNDQREIVRKITFYHAYLCKYTEYIGKNSSEAFFELIVKQKTDYRTSIKISPCQTKPLLTENIFDTKEMLSDYENIKQSDSILQEKRYVIPNIEGGRLSLHQIPATDSPIVEELLEGQEMTITKNYRVDADGHNWVYVTLSNGKSGWVSSDCLTPTAPKIVNNTVQQPPIISSGASGKWIPKEIMQYNGDSDEEKYFKKMSQKFTKLSWNQGKIDELWESVITIKEKYGIEIDPRFLMAVIIQEGTGSFNTSSSNRAADGQHGAESNYAVDLMKANNLIFGKMLGYIYYGDEFKKVVVESAGKYEGITGNGDVFQYINWETPIIRMTSLRVDIGVYAGNGTWGDNVRSIYSKRLGGDVEGYSNYLENFDKSFVEKIANDLGITLRNCKFVVSQNAQDSKGDENGEYTVSGVLN